MRKVLKWIKNWAIEIYGHFILFVFGHAKVDESVPRCRKCGCTDLKIAERILGGPCEWVEEDLCPLCKLSIQMVEKYESDFVDSFVYGLSDRKPDGLFSSDHNFGDWSGLIPGFAAQKRCEMGEGSETAKEIANFLNVGYEGNDRPVAIVNVTLPRPVLTIIDDYVKEPNAEEHRQKVEGYYQKLNDLLNMNDEEREAVEYGQE